MDARTRKSGNKGHWAKSPGEMPWPAWKDIAKRTWTRTWQDNVGLVSAGVAYYGFLAVVPLLGLIVLVYGLVADRGTVVSNMQMLTAILPADVAKLIGKQLLGVVETSRQTKGLGILFATVVALYGATNGAGALITALNIAYEEKEKRSLLRFYGTTIVMTLAAVILAVVALAGTTVVAFFGRVVPTASPILVIASRILTYALLALIAAAVGATLYRYAPSREDARWEWITPGSIFAAVTWLLLTVGFGFYVSHVSDYNATYGSLGTVIVLLTWIYLSAYALIFGAELNSEIEHQTARDSTTGKPVPMGTRGAWAADHVAQDDEPDTKDTPTMAEATPDAPGQKTNKTEEKSAN
jgi:membrane protein